MKLTGKCKEDFEKYLYKTYSENQMVYLARYNDYPDSFKYGVYVDFFDTVKILIDVTSNLGYTYNNSVYFKGKEYDISMMATRVIARSKAVEKANEVYNKSWNKEI